jgi:hypothetical protein
LCQEFFNSLAGDFNGFPGAEFRRPLHGCSDVGLEMLANFAVPSSWAASSPSGGLHPNLFGKRRNS